MDSEERVLVMALARHAVKTAIKRDGHKVSHFPASQIRKAAEAVASQFEPQLLALVQELREVYAKAGRLGQ